MNIYQTSSGWLEKSISRLVNPPLSLLCSLLLLRSIKKGQLNTKHQVKMIIRAQGSLSGQGMPMLNAACLLNGGYDSCDMPNNFFLKRVDVDWTDVDSFEGEVITCLSLKLYGELHNARWYRMFFNLAASELYEELSTFNLPGDVHKFRVKLPEWISNSLAKNILLAFAPGTSSLKIITGSGSESNRCALSVALKYNEKLGFNSRKVLVSSQAHSMLIKDLGRDAVVFPVDPENGFQPDNSALLRILQEHQDCRVLVLTAPTTNFNTVEGLSDEVIKVIRERNIWVHVDGALSQLLGGLPTKSSADLRELISSDFVRSFSYNAHKAVGLDAVGVLYLLWKEDQDVLGEYLEGASYISTGLSPVLQTTSMSHGRYLSANYKLQSLGHKGCYYLFLVSHLAAVTLASLLKKKNIELFCEPATQAVSIKLKNEKERVQVVRTLRHERPLSLDVAVIPKVNTKNGEECGIRVVMPLGVLWDYDSLSCLGEIVSSAIARSRGQGCTFSKTAYKNIPGRDELLEVPQVWLDRIYDYFNSKLQAGGIYRKQMSNEELLNACKLIIHDLSREKPPKPNRLLRKRAEYYGEKHRVISAEELFPLPK